MHVKWLNYYWQLFCQHHLCLQQISILMYFAKVYFLNFFRTPYSPARYFQIKLQQIFEYCFKIIETQSINQIISKLLYKFHIRFQFLQGSSQQVYQMKTNNSHRLDIYTFTQNSLKLKNISHQQNYDDYMYQTSKAHEIGAQNQNYKSENCQKILNNEGEDFTQLWNQLSQQKIQENGLQNDEIQINQQNIQNKDNSEQKQKEYINNEVEQKNSMTVERQRSFCQLDDEQMKMWMNQCQNISFSTDNFVDPTSTVYKQQNQGKDSNQSQISGLDQIWQMIEKQCQQQANEQPFKEKIQVIKCKQTNQQQKKISIIQIKDNFLQNQKDVNQKSPIKQIVSQISLPIYYEYQGFYPIYIHEIQKDEGQQNYERTICEIIHSEIYQEVDDQDTDFRNYDSQILIYGLDYLISNPKKFCQSNLRRSTHTHFGMKCYGKFPISNKFLDQNKQGSYTQKKDYLFQPIAGQCLIETQYIATTNSFQTKKSVPNIEKINFYLCANHQKIAVGQKIILNQNPSKKQIYQLKSYDTFSKKTCEYLGIVQTKVAKRQDQWFCDSIIYLPLKKIYTKKINNHDWEKLKISLKINDGVLMAQLGVQSAISSVTNCILYSEDATCQFMLGLLSQTQYLSNYVLRTGGISPLLAMMTAISRKQFACNSD